MNVKIQLKCLLKNQPKGYLGITQEGVEVGKNPAPILDVILATISSILDFWIATHYPSPEDADKLIKDIIAALKTTKFEKV